MTGKRALSSEEEIGRALVELGRQLDYPKPPDLATAVADRLRGDPQEWRTPVLVSFPRLRSVRRAVVLAAAAVLLVAGIAVAARFTLRGVEIRLLETPPAAPTAAPGDNLALGRPVDLATAQSTVGFRLLSSHLDEFEVPDGVFLDDRFSGGRVTFVYGPQLGLPEDPLTDLGMLITQFRAEPDDEFLVKEAGPRTTVQRVSVGDAPGFWIEGEPHTVLYRDPGGQPLPDTIRLAGNVLLWQVGDVTLRLEANLSRTDAIRIAESFA